LNRILRIAGWISQLPTRGAQWVSGGALVAIVLLVSIDVILRATLNLPVLGSYELSQLMMVFVAVFSFSYCQVFRNHISIPVITQRFPKRVQAVLESISWLIGCVLFALVAWQSIIHGITLTKAGQETLALGIPVGPFYFVIVAGMILFSLVLLADFIVSLPKVRQ